MSSPLYSIITTIQPPTAAVIELAGRLKDSQSGLIIVGDKKGPAAYPVEGATFYALDAQLATPFKLARLLPTGHYTRKNVGYLAAIAAGAACIYETDDDNAPLAVWALRTKETSAVTASGQGWLNVYRHFSDDRIWPRGFPLDAIVASCTDKPAAGATCDTVTAPIQQGLANNSPDVDAVWRLVLDRPFNFKESASILLPPGAWCPFNSQSTWWWPEAYPLLYLPSFCTFRMTDIWRSFIAQRCLWEMGYGVVFHAPEVVQDRNEHDLMRDFNDEIPGYQQNRLLVRILEGLNLRPGTDAVGDNLRSCYESLIQEGISPDKELPLVEAWLDDLKILTRAPPDQIDGYRL